jgi:hypothetical protein
MPFDRTLSRICCVLLLGVVGCVGEPEPAQPPGGPQTMVPPGQVPTGPPPDMAFPDRTMTMTQAPGAAAGSGAAGVGGAANAAAGQPAAAGGAAGAAGGAAGSGGDPGSVPGNMPMTDGPLNMAPAMFGPNIKVSDDTGRGQQTEVVMAAHKDGMLFVGWMDNRMSPSRCGYSVSMDGGMTWSKNTFASTQGSGRAFAGDPAVAIDDAGNLYAGCQDYASGGLGTNYILLGHSKDRGATWSEFERVNQSLDKPWLGANGDGVVIVSWLGNPGGVKRSTDYGATWGDPISLGYINHGTTMSVAEESTGLVHMAYNTNENTVTYRRSKDFGETFEPAQNLSPQGQPCRSPCSPRSHPIVGSDTDPTGKIVAITWASRQNHPDAEDDDDVWVIVSTDGGETYSDPIRANDNTSPSRQFQPWVAVDKYGAVHAVWTDLRDNGQNATYYARMTDFEAGFEPNVEITDGTGEPASFLGDYKGIDVVGRDVVVTWTDTRNDSGDIYFARAKDAAAAGGPLMK